MINLKYSDIYEATINSVADNDIELKSRILVTYYIDDIEQHAKKMLNPDKSNTKDYQEMLSVIMAVGIKDAIYMIENTLKYESNFSKAVEYINHTILKGKEYL